MKTIDDIFSRFLEAKRLEGCKVDEKHFVTARSFVRFCKKSGNKYFTQNLIDGWLTKKKSEKDKSFYCRVSAARTLLAFGVENGYADVSIPKHPPVLPRKRTLVTELPLDKTIISDRLNEYLVYLRGQGKSSNAYNREVQILRLFNVHCCKVYPNANCLTDEIIDSWCAKRDTECPASRNMRTRPVRSFIKFGIRHNWFNVSMPENLPHVRINPRIPHGFTMEELNRFFEVADNLPSSKKINELHDSLNRMTPPVYFRLLYSTGMRTNEVRELRRENVDLEHGIINIIHTKGPGQHRVALHPSMLSVLRGYDLAVNQLIPDREIFFPDEHDRVHCSLWQFLVFRSIWAQVSEEDARAYDLRSNYAVTNINSWNYDGTDWFDKLLVLSRTMGHTNIESTCYYYQLAPMFPDMLEQMSGIGLHEIISNNNIFFEKYETEE